MLANDLPVAVDPARISLAILSRAILSLPKINNGWYYHFNYIFYSPPEHRILKKGEEGTKICSLVNQDLTILIHKLGTTCLSDLQEFVRVQ